MCELDDVSRSGLDLARYNLGRSWFGTFYVCEVKVKMYKKRFEIHKVFLSQSKKKRVSVTAATTGYHFLLILLWRKNRETLKPFIDTLILAYVKVVSLTFYT